MMFQRNAKFLGIKWPGTKSNGIGSSDDRATRAERTVKKRRHRKLTRQQSRMVCLTGT